MMRKLATFSVLILATVTGCGDFRAAINPAESEPDYAPGFFEDSIDHTQDDLENGEINGDLPDPETLQESVLNKPLQTLQQTFPQTEWNECSANPITGNYLEAACVQRRGISVILNSYLQGRLVACVNEGMKAQTGPGEAQAVHITHAGITADPRHSPRSLHAHNRAIDVKQIKATMTDGSVRQYTYSKLGNRPFYTALRNCWGEVVHTYNGCPYIRGKPLLTGSIGWENSQHGHHMHLSVPYCVSGNYGPGVSIR